jgi:hypothetical protein
MDSTKAPISPQQQTTIAIVEKTKGDARAQPWKQHLEEIQKEAEQYSKTNQPGSDLFKVEEGFNDHGMSG